MDVLIAVEQRYQRTPDGRVWTTDQYAYSFFTRYLDVFDRVKVVSRVRDVERVSDTMLPADGAGVSIVPLPHYHGFSEYVRQRSAVERAARAAITLRDAVILRVPATIATLAVGIMRRAGFPYAVEVISDPAMTFAPGASQHPLRPLFRWQFVSALKQHCAHAAAASYVTRHYLQRAYPCPAYSVGISDVELPDDAFVDTAHRVGDGDAPIRLVMVGSLVDYRKGQDVLLDAFERCTAEGLNLHLTIIGDGATLSQLQARAAAAGLSERITFTGKLPGAAAVRLVVDTADLFVMPSRAEGLPRALIEAMARGLPCIGTRVGGIPELLAAEDMVEAGDAAGLTAKLMECVMQPARMNAAAERNLALARQYHQRELSSRHVAFYAYVRGETARWLARRGAQTGVSPAQT